MECWIQDYCFHRDPRKNLLALTWAKTQTVTSGELLEVLDVLELLGLLKVETVV